MTRGQLELRHCSSCGFIHNASFEPDKLSYGESYNNSQNHSEYFHEYTKELSRSIVHDGELKSGTVIEVGCGKADFLKQIFELSDQLTGYGFDPSYEGPEEAYDGRLNFKREFYGPAFEYIQADVIVCRHVIEHIPDPVEMLVTIRNALVHSPKAKVYFETPCVEWILNNNVVWDFFYEHCSYFSKSSLTTAFKKAGFKVEAVRHVFNGQYLWLEAVLDHEAAGEHQDRDSMLAVTQRYTDYEPMLLARWEEQIASYMDDGVLAIWGAGAKGVTFVNLFDPHRQKISCVVDVNPSKQGGYLPGTGHPIVDVKELGNLKAANVILMNPNYKDEIVRLLKTNHIDTKVVELSI
ncbi:class I SAM-dependent methyltransferase [Paenibacillus mendelii]|uniref:Class I SAM-dependent methyltransferase n=1 Tax=Paenibacillus mendelii TaxID=206163 RepID=A0ABV6J4I0_9BACL|nr:class I SAM-dependent methyltransferase [Paenibacillus mendelii]MCQ6563575.1 class I SAM-dependent methyltransferase [Paenibacillus mendelii]